VVPTFLSLTGAVLAQSAMRRRDSIPKEDYAWGWKWRKRKMRTQIVAPGAGTEEERWMMMGLWRERERERVTCVANCNSGSFVERGRALEREEEDGRERQ